MNLDRANIDVDTVEDFDVAAAITEVVEETNASNGSNVDWLIGCCFGEPVTFGISYQVPLSLNWSEPDEKRKWRTRDSLNKEK